MVVQYNTQYGTEGNVFNIIIIITINKILVLYVLNIAQGKMAQ